MKKTGKIEELEKSIENIKAHASNSERKYHRYQQVLRHHEQCISHHTYEAEFWRGEIEINKYQQELIAKELKRVELELEKANALTPEPEEAGKRG